MESKKLYFFKICVSVLFSSLILGAFAYVCIKGDLQHNALSFSCIGACFLLSLLFIRLTAKKIIFTLALAMNVVADCFLVLLPSDKNYLVGICLMCAVQAIYLIYTLFLLKTAGLCVISLAVRTALCLLAYFLLPKYYVISTIQMLYVMIVINSFVTLLTFLLRFKTQWVSFFGFLLFFAFDFFSALSAGWGLILGMPINFLTFIVAPYSTLPGMAFLCYIPAVLLLALSSVWELGIAQKKVSVARTLEKKTENFAQSNLSATEPKKQEGETINRATQTEGISTVSLDDL